MVDSAQPQFRDDCTSRQMAADTFLPPDTSFPRSTCRHQEGFAARMILPKAAYTILPAVFISMASRIFCIVFNCRHSFDRPTNITPHQPTITSFQCLYTCLHTRRTQFSIHWSPSKRHKADADWPGSLRRFAVYHPTETIAITLTRRHTV